MAATFDLTGSNRIFCGADYSFGVTLRDGAGNPLDLTGATLACQIRRVPASPELLADFAVLVTDAPAGKATFSLSAGVTATLPATTPPNFWRHDVLMTRPDGVKVRLLEGSVEVDPAVTR